MLLRESKSVPNGGKDETTRKSDLLSIAAGLLLATGVTFVANGNAATAYCAARRRAGFPSLVARGPSNDRNAQRFCTLKPGETVGWHTTGKNEESLVVLRGQGER